MTMRDLKFPRLAETIDLYTFKTEEESVDCNMSFTPLAPLLSLEILISKPRL